MSSHGTDLGNSTLDFLRTSNLIGFVRLRADGVFSEANNAFLDLVGYSREELVGKMTWRDVTPPEFHEVSMQTHRRVLRTGTTHPIEKDYIRKDGKRLTVFIGSVRANGDDVVGFILDITQRKSAEQALREAHQSLMQSKERFRLAVVHSPDIMYFQDAELRFVWVSRVLPPLRMEDVIGKTDFDFPPIERARSVAETKRRVMRTGRGERVQSVLELGGKLTYFETALEPRIDDAGNVIGVAGYLRNMTEWREKEMELSHANASLEQMRQTLEQRVAERTADLARSESRLRESEEHQRKIAEHNLRLVREVEHRVRNHLANLVGLVQVMRERATSVKSFADAIESRLRAMAHVHQVLAAGGWDAVGLQSLIESTLASLSYVSPHACDIDVAGDPVPITANHALPLALILAEWFTNSIKYGSCGLRGGKVAIHWNMAHHPDKGGRPWVTLTWTESAGPPISGEITPSVGTALVQGFATQELSGECELSYPQQGAAHTLRFPLGG